MMVPECAKKKGTPVLVTGAAGFIGSHLCKRLSAAGYAVTGFDNFNDYYDPQLKRDRVQALIPREVPVAQGDLADKAAVWELMEKVRPEIVVNLAAQAGVRYSIDHPDTYIASNVVGFFNVLEACRAYPVRHLVYASSSSVYGNQKKTPFSTDDPVDHPISLYAATKKTDELMAFTYSHLYRIPTTGLRFFTVYGPWGRPDMACGKFAKRIFEGAPIEVYNHGDMYRDFTYIDDIVEGVFRLLDSPPAPDACEGAPYRVYNIGNSRPEKLMDFIAALETALGRTAEKRFLPMQPGDVYETYADVSALVSDFGFAPDTPVREGLARFAAWYLAYYGKRE